MKLIRRPSATPLWRDEFAINQADERYVNRRQFAKFLVLTSLGMVAGNVWIADPLACSTASPCSSRARSRARRETPVGGVTLFNYPGEHDPCILVRTGAETFVAYSQKCTHLSCAVVLRGRGATGWSAPATRATSRWRTGRSCRARRRGRCRGSCSSAAARSWSPPAVEILPRPRGPAPPRAARCATGGRHERSGEGPWPRRRLHRRRAGAHRRAPRRPDVAADRRPRVATSPATTRPRCRPPSSPRCCSWPAWRFSCSWTRWTRRSVGAFERRVPARGPAAFLPARWPPLLYLGFAHACLAAAFAVAAWRPAGDRAASTTTRG